MFAAFVGFTATVVSLCGPTLSQSSSALPAKELGCPLSDDTQAIPEMPPPPGPFVPLLASSVQLMRPVSRRCLVGAASAVVAAASKRPVTLADGRVPCMVLTFRIYN